MFCWVVVNSWCFDWSKVGSIIGIHPHMHHTSILNRPVHCSSMIINTEVLKTCAIIPHFIFLFCLFFTYVDIIVVCMLYAYAVELIAILKVHLNEKSPCCCLVCAMNLWPSQPSLKQIFFYCWKKIFSTFRTWKRVNLLLRILFWGGDCSVVTMATNRMPAQARQPIIPRAALPGPTFRCVFQAEAVLCLISLRHWVNSNETAAAT